MSFEKSRSSMPRAASVPRARRRRADARLSVLLGDWERGSGRAMRSTPRLDAQPATRHARLRGLLQLVGRIGQMVIRGGGERYPREIESFLTATRNPDVPVIGVPDPALLRRALRPGLLARLRYGGEAPKRSAPSAKAQIAHYKIPAITSNSWRLSDYCNRQDPEVPDARAVNLIAGLILPKTPEGPTSAGRFVWFAYYLSRRNSPCVAPFWTCQVDPDLSMTVCPARDLS